MYMVWFEGPKEAIESENSAKTAAHFPYSDI